jgi:hypothetical protein
MNDISSQAVITGLDPVIQGPAEATGLLDCRIKSGNDKSAWAPREADG